MGVFLDTLYMENNWNAQNAHLLYYLWVYRSVEKLYKIRQHFVTFQKPTPAVL